MAKVLGYKGMLFIDGFKDRDSLVEGKTIELSDLTDALINDPTKTGQLGFVCDMNKCQINREALEILKEVKRSDDDIGAVDVFSSNNGPVFTWLGGPLMVSTASELEGSRAYDYDLLNKVKTIDLEIPQDVIDFAESKGDENEQTN